MSSPAVLTVDFQGETDTAGLLVAPHGRVRFLDVPELRFLMIDGSGAPGEAQFRDAMGALYPVAYTLHFALKERGLGAPIGTLEGLFGDGTESPANPTLDTWTWRLLLAVPAVATDGDVATAIEDVGRTRAPLALPRLRLEHWAEGQCAQTMHVGPYSEEAPTVALLLQVIADAGLRPAGRHHEIYLGNPNRTRADRLRTIIRLPVEPA